MSDIQSVDIKEEENKMQTKELKGVSKTKPAIAAGRERDVAIENSKYHKLTALAEKTSPGQNQADSPYVGWLLGCLLFLFTIMGIRWLWKFWSTPSVPPALAGVPDAAVKGLTEYVKSAPK